MRPALVLAVMGALHGAAYGQRCSVVAGFGVEGFVESHMRHVVGAGPAWSLRGVVGNPQSVSVEVVYVGSRQPIEMGGDTLLGTGALGQIRINVYPDARFDPFFFLGAGWSRFTVRGRTAGSPFPAHDDVIAIPMGLGIAYRAGSFITDVRAGFTTIAAPDLVAKPMPDGSEDSFAMHRIGITADLGWYLY